MKTIWPRKSGEYKVVQIIVKQQRYLLFEDKQHKFHQQILRYFLEKNNIRFTTIEAKFGTSPALEGEGYKVPGMGRIKIDVENKTYIFFGKSANYQISPDHKFKVEMS